jgi:hypothetical protein
VLVDAHAHKYGVRLDCGKELGVPAKCATLLPQLSFELPIGKVQPIEQQGFRECLPRSIQTILGLSDLPLPQVPLSVGDYATENSAEVLSYYVGLFKERQLTVRPKELPSTPQLRLDALHEWMRRNKALAALGYSHDHFVAILAGTIIFVLVTVQCGII